MKTDPKLSADTVQDLIRAAERRHGIRLSIEDFDFLTAAIQDFVGESIEKFISGAAKHNSDGDHNFLEVDHLSEMRKEAVDLWFYQIGLKHKLSRKS